SARTCFGALSLHDALPIWRGLSCADTTSHASVGSKVGSKVRGASFSVEAGYGRRSTPSPRDRDHIYVTLSVETSSIVRLNQQCRSEEHTSELQSPDHLVCR